tara:strand:- start:110 stop:349 length:240 start_codon:yes stop_codon:yes gene_type:complete
MNILNESQEARKIRNRLRLRLIQELEVACDEIKKDALYKMFTGESRTLMTFDYWINWISLDELKTVLEQVREENNKLIF